MVDLEKKESLTEFTICHSNRQLDFQTESLGQLERTCYSAHFILFRLIVKLSIGK